MKKFIKLLLIFLSILFVFNYTSATANIRTSEKLKEKLKSSVVLHINNPKAIVNNQEAYIDYTNKEVYPFIKDGRTLVPVRFISENIGANVDWNQETRKVTITMGNDSVEFTIGSNNADYYHTSMQNVGDDSRADWQNVAVYSSIELDVPAQIINERTFLPLRAVVEALGKSLVWDDRGIIVISDEDNKINQKDEIELLDEIEDSFNDMAKLEIDKVKFENHIELSESEYNSIVENIKKNYSVNEIGGIFAGRLKKLPAGHSFVVANTTEGKLYLYGVTNDLKVKLLTTFDDASINDVKLNIAYSDEYINVWSQKPFSAFERTEVMKWDGQKLIRSYYKFADPTYESLEQMKKLIDEGKYDQLDKEEFSLMYPLFYYDFLNMNKYAVQSAHKRALEQYKNSDIKSSISTMEWGIGYYLNFYKDTLDWKDSSKISEAELKERFEFSSDEEKLTIKEFAGVLNDYAFFLSEDGRNKEAETFLKKVVELDSSRVVAYINLGDVSWNLGKNSEAKNYYNKYLELLGNNTKNVPQRVFDRIK